eukprot:Phypoly_transcript_05558.p1 GENE.Phypoly_transcript_05558~~Phypoly_transcript_05558.p1  ORF type:complete len:295 (+),score=36.46 Phypoly_transcript_05558:122-886(+)
MDPGWRSPLIRFEYEKNLLTTDGKWTYPDGTEVENLKECSYDPKTSQIFGIRTYYDQLASLVTVIGDDFAGSFSGSAGYENAKKYSDTVFIATLASCSVYKANLLPLDKYAYSRSKAFLSAVASLPSAYSTKNSAKFHDFFDDWGTHFAYQIIMGAREADVSAFSSARYEDLISSNFSVTSAAVSSWERHNGVRGEISDTEKRSISYFESTRNEIKRINLGVPPPFNDGACFFLSSPLRSPYTLLPSPPLLFSS